ncbi:MAG TPA: RsmE family RNA methyltransferase [Kiritimatiellia bacterium]|nr:RsmE family RNA methyltransferase [Kiritimatiellia bacterium]HMP97966.1 RsmE family RNA methyltransferase [Kiritimatiellia bacterium]
MNCVLFSETDIQPDGSVLLRDEAARHIVRVLKKQPGDTLCAGRVDGPLGIASILAVDPDGVRITQPVGEPPPLPPVDLILAMPRPKVMKRLWAPLASVGVGSISIIGAERVERCYFDSHALQPELIRTRLIKGLEQARDTRLPSVRVFKTFQQAAEQELPAIAPHAARFIAHPGPATAITEACARLGGRNRAVVAVGPEGGWSSPEMATFADHGFIPISLGPRALRTDVAVIGLLTLLRMGIGSP